MRRRGFLALGAIASGGALAEWLIRRLAVLRGAEGTVLFYVAGVRFQKPVPNLKTGDSILIKPEMFRGERSYAVVAGQGQTIGYVPRHLVSTVQRGEVVRAQLYRAQPDAVPWKRFQVSLSLRRATVS
ncbi:MAG: hypothetical protein WAL89_00990 [Candidatus Sulfotelmatobacter sp.]|jgi:hypothetical protein